MKEPFKLKNWQLLRWKGKCAQADLTAVELFTLGKGAFQNCRELEEATLPTSLTTVKTKAFLSIIMVRSTN
jgi:hypothetical protein